MVSVTLDVGGESKKEEPEEQGGDTSSAISNLVSSSKAFKHALSSSDRPSAQLSRVRAAAFSDGWYEYDRPYHLLYCCGFPLYMSRVQVFCTVDKEFPSAEVDDATVEAYRSEHPILNGRRYDVRIVDADLSLSMIAWEDRRRVYNLLIYVVGGVLTMIAGIIGLTTSGNGFITAILTLISGFLTGLINKAYDDCSELMDDVKFFRTLIRQRFSHELPDISDHHYHHVLNSHLTHSTTTSPDVKAAHSTVSRSVPSSPQSDTQRTLNANERSPLLAQNTANETNHTELTTTNVKKKLKNNKKKDGSIDNTSHAK